MLDNKNEQELDYIKMASRRHENEQITEKEYDVILNS